MFLLAQVNVYPGGQAWAAPYYTRAGRRAALARGRWAYLRFVGVSQGLVRRSLPLVATRGSEVLIRMV